VPENWDEYKIKRKFRGSLYNINFKRTGKFLILVDGKQIKGNVIPQIKKSDVNVVVEF